MQTPQEKADELYEYCILEVQMIDKYSYLTRSDEEYFAKLFAIKMCDVVLGDMGADRGYSFWSEVKYILQQK